MSSAQRWQVGVEAAGERLDRYVVQRRPELSRVQVQRWIEHGHIRVDGEISKPRHHLKTGEWIELQAPSAPVVAGMVAQAIPLDILYDDDDLVVINKGADMVVHPGPGHPEGTLVNALLARFPQLLAVGDVERPGLVHRLDRGTSGVIVVAKHDQAHRALAAQFAVRTVEKRYLALCLGRVPPQGQSDAPIGRHPTDRQRMSTRSRRGREALTFWEVREYFASVLSWLEVRLATGRTHQIRVHLSALGFPLVGDAQYGGARRAAQLPAPWAEFLPQSRLALHAWRLALIHPRTALRCEWEAPLPPDLQQLLVQCREAGRT